MSNDPAKPPRFPYIGALLCAACVGAAVWTWMRYSYCWDVTPGSLCRAALAHVEDSWIGRYVDVHGETSAGWTLGPDGRHVFADVIERRRSSELDRDHNGDEPKAAVFPLYGHSVGLRIRDEDYEGASQRENWLGRVVAEDKGARKARVVSAAEGLSIDTTASRLTGASIAGLVVGAMGVFVFTVALRDWLGERRKFLADIQGHNTGVEADRNA